MFNGTFYKRADTGSTEPMNWHEVRDQMLYTEGRLQQVRLLRLKIAKEQYGEAVLQLMKAKNGSYQREKASFCLAQANDEREKADNMDRKENRTVPNITEADTQEAVSIFRTHAANWLRMAAACLEMPNESRSTGT